jgi:hypothetical protein
MRKNIRNQMRGAGGAIVGQAVLFAVVGCGDGGGTTTGGGGEAAGGSVGGAGGQADVGTGGVVMGGSGGSGGAGGLVAGGSGGSGGVIAGGAGGSGGVGGAVAGGSGGSGGAVVVDAGVITSDAAVVAPADGSVVVTPDGSVVVTPDAAVSPPDGAVVVVPDAAPPPAMCGDQIGQPCEVSNEGCCDAAGNGQVWCQPDANGALTYQAIPPDFFCNCYDDPATGKTMVACAVPGFVGIDRAHRTRRTGRRLRDLGRVAA